MNIYRIYVAPSSAGTTRSFTVIAASKADAIWRAQRFLSQWEEVQGVGLVGEWH